MVHLDLKDRKILYELDTNSRQPYSAIAKKVRLSKDSVMYRINKLTQEGVIKHFHTLINVSKLGYMSFRLYLKFQNATPEKEQEIINYFKTKKQIGWLVSIDGKYQLGMWIIAKSIKEMNDLWKEFSNNYQNYIQKKDLTIFTHVSYFPRAYLLEKDKNLHNYTFITEPEEKNIDEKDLKLLNLLAHDARMPLIDIAKELNITPKTAASKIKELEDQEIIVGYRTMFDLGKLGYQYFKVHFNLHNTTQEKRKEFKSYIHQHPYIIYDNEVLGGDDIEIEIQVKTLQDFQSVMNDLKQRFAKILKNYSHMLFYKEHKFVFFPEIISLQ